MAQHDVQQRWKLYDYMAHAAGHRGDGEEGRPEAKGAGNRLIWNQLSWIETEEPGGGLVVAAVQGSSAICGKWRTPAPPRWSSTRCLKSRSNWKAKCWTRSAIGSDVSAEALNCFPD